MTVLLAWWSIPVVLLIVLIYLARKKTNNIVRRAAVYSLSVYLIFTIIGTLHIFSMRSSTAGIGLLFLPLYALFPAGAAYLLGYFHGRYKEQIEVGNSTTQYSLSMALCILLLTGAFGWQFSAISETNIKNTERDIKKAKRNTDIKENRQRVQWVLARYKGREAEKLNELASETTDDTMLMAIAGSRYAQEELLDSLSHQNNLAVTLTVVRNKNTSPRTLKWIYHEANNSRYFYSDLARNSKTPENILRDIYEHRHTNGGIAWSLAKNESTPIDILRKLANEPDDNVQRHLNNNKSYVNTK